MSDIAIRVENLFKLYRIGATQERHDTLRDAVTGLFRRRPSSPAPHSSDTDLWALKDVSFEVKQGEVVGIIGRNGAGKSTLLKILSRITEPTSGRVSLHGRVASLLEVGTGFHPELTGRENIFLNGAILGMKRTEIDRKFDEIVDFSGVEKFLDTPVKRYSSGMHVRLAFAVAAHLEPEILLVDEVLAVGDAAFQSKCLGKMGNVAREGRTVVFVSHNMAAVMSLCREAHLLDLGQIAHSGATEKVVEGYMSRNIESPLVPLHLRTDREGNGKARITSITIENGEGRPSIRCSDRLRVTIGYTSEQLLSNSSFLVGIYDQFNRSVFFLDSGVAGGISGQLPACGQAVCITDPINLTPGACFVNLAILENGAIADHIGHVCTIEVEADDFYGTGKLSNRQTTLCLIKQEWRVKDD